MKQFILFFTSVFCLLSQLALAHSPLHHSVPAQDAILEQSPEHLALTFGDTVQLVKLTVIDQTGESLDLSFTPMKGKALTVPFNELLKPGVYQVNWMILGADAHKMKGLFNFTVKQ